MNYSPLELQSSETNWSIIPIGVEFKNEPFGKVSFKYPLNSYINVQKNTILDIIYHNISDKPVVVHPSVQKTTSDSITTSYSQSTTAFMTKSMSASIGIKLLADLTVGENESVTTAMTKTKDSSDTHTVNHLFTASSNYNVEAGKCLRVKAEYEYLPVYLSPMSVLMLLTATYENGELYKNKENIKAAKLINKT